MSAPRSFHIAGGGLTVECLDHGASIRDVRLAGVAHSLVLGLADPADYLEHSPHMGAIAGRVANRLRDATFDIGGVTYRGPANAEGGHMLHGGPHGFGRQAWRIADSDAETVRFALDSADGDAGFPGRLQATCRYRCVGNGCLDLELEAVTDAPTLVNMAPHPYFNLDASDTIDGHRLSIAAQAYTPTGPGLVPTGAVALVAGTRLDFTALRPVGSDPHDQNYCLTAARCTTLRHAAHLRAGRVALHVSTTEPGLQLYTGDHLALSVPGLGGRRHGPRAGLCLESQAWPDAPHHPHFPGIELQPGARYRHHTRYRFTLAG